jgi:large subunit ribosomal protein L10
MLKSKKVQVVSDLQEELKNVESLILCNFKGVNVDDDTKLRRALQKSGSQYRVVKNTLLKLAFKDTPFSALDDKLIGNTAISYNREDVVGLAKALSEFAKNHKTFEIKGGVLQGKAIEASQVEDLAKMPPKEVLLAKLLYMLNFPVQGMATALNNLVRNFVVVLDQIAKQKSESQ